MYSTAVSEFCCTPTLNITPRLAWQCKYMMVGGFWRGAVTRWPVLVLLLGVCYCRTYDNNMVATKPQRVQEPYGSQLQCNHRQLSSVVCSNNNNIEKKCQNTAVCIGADWKWQRQKEKNCGVSTHTRTHTHTRTGPQWRAVSDLTGQFFPKSSSARQEKKLGL